MATTVRGREPVSRARLITDSSSRLASLGPPPPAPRPRSATAAAPSHCQNWWCSCARNIHQTSRDTVPARTSLRAHEFLLRTANHHLQLARPTSRHVCVQRLPPPRQERAHHRRKRGHWRGTSRLRSLARRSDVDAFVDPRRPPPSSSPRYGLD